MSKHKNTRLSWEMFDKYINNFSKKICCAPENSFEKCKEKIVKAHSLQRAITLTNIAVDSMVYSFLPLKIESFDFKSKTKIYPYPLEISKASTFNGFCRRHDDEIFKKIEKEDFFKTKEQCFLLAYRVICREYYTKVCAVDSASKETASALDNLLKFRGTPIEFQRAIRIYNIHKATRDIDKWKLHCYEKYKSDFDKNLLEKSHSALDHIVFEFDSIFPVAVTGSFNVEYDLNGNKLQDATPFNNPEKILCLTSFSDREKSYIVLSWSSGDKSVGKKFVESMLHFSSLKLGGAIFNIIFSFCENLHISPEWWEGLEDNAKEFLIDRYNDVSDEVRKVYPLEIESLDIKKFSLKRIYLENCQVSF